MEWKGEEVKRKGKGQCGMSERGMEREGNLC